MPSSPIDQAVAEIQPAFLILIRLLVDDMDAVTLTPERQGDGVLFRLKVAQRDIGKVIGQGGRIARSLRTIIHAASMKYKLRFTLDIEEIGA